MPEASEARLSASNLDRREAELASMKADLEHWRGVADRLEATS